jgi:hypothetical protein
VLRWISEQMDQCDRPVNDALFSPHHIHFHSRRYCRCQPSCLSFSFPPHRLFFAGHCLCHCHFFALNLTLTTLQLTTLPPSSKASAPVGWWPERPWQHPPDQNPAPVRGNSGNRRRSCERPPHLCARGSSATHKLSCPWPTRPLRVNSGDYAAASHWRLLHRRSTEA